MERVKLKSKYLLNGGSAYYGQLFCVAVIIMVVVFFSLAKLLLFPAESGITLAIFIVIFSFLFSWRYFRVKDIYLIKDYIFIRSLFNTQKIPVNECYKLDLSVFPTVFYLQFNSGKTIYSNVKIYNFRTRKFYNPESFVKHLRERIRVHKYGKPIEKHVS